jgi:hypothetical protein
VAVAGADYYDGLTVGKQLSLRALHFLAVYLGLDTHIATDNTIEADVSQCGALHWHFTLMLHGHRSS